MTGKTEYQFRTDSCKATTLTDLKKVYNVVWPIQREVGIVHFMDVKRELMRQFKLNRWELDKRLFQLQSQTCDGQTFAFYFGRCGWRPGSRLNYISRAGKHDTATFDNSFCFITLDRRNSFIEKLEPLNGEASA